MGLRKGTKVRQVVPVITGVVEDAKFDVESGKFEYLVQFNTTDGGVTQRWFKEEDVAVDDEQGAA